MSIRCASLVWLAVTLSVMPALAQDSTQSLPAGLPSDYSTGSTVTTSANGQPLLPEGNPLSGLFTPQPQFPTAQTIMNPTPNVPDQYAKNPIGGLFNVSAPAGANAPPPGSNNMLQNLFTGQTPFQTPQAQQNPNPEPQARYVVPGFGQPNLGELQKAGINYKIFDPSAPIDQNNYPGRVPDAKYSPNSVVDTSKNKKDPAKTATDAIVKDRERAAGRDKDSKSVKDASLAKDSVLPKSLSSQKDQNSANGLVKAKDASAAKDSSATTGDAAKSASVLQGSTLSKPYNPLQDAALSINAGQPQQALTTVSEFLKQYPANAQAHYLAAVARVSLRDFASAAFEYREVLRLVPATQLANLAVEGLKKINAPAIPAHAALQKLPPLQLRK